MGLRFGMVCKYDEVGFWPVAVKWKKIAIEEKAPSSLKKKTDIKAFLDGSFMLEAFITSFTSFPTQISHC